MWDPLQHINMFLTSLTTDMSHVTSLANVYLCSMTLVNLCHYFQLNWPSKPWSSPQSSSVREVGLSQKCSARRTTTPSCGCSSNYSKRCTQQNRRRRETSQPRSSSCVKVTWPQMSLTPSSQTSNMCSRTLRVERRLASIWFTRRK